MADTTNKKSASDSGEPVSSVKVGGDNQAGGARKPLPLSISKKKVLTLVVELVIAGVVLVGIVAVINKVHNDNKVYAQAAGHKIYKKDVQNLKGKTKNVSDRQAATVLADKYLTEALAKERHIAVTDQDIQAQYGPDTNLAQQKKTDAYSYQAQVNSAYFDKLQHQYDGEYKGFVLVTQFSRYIPSRPVTPALKAAIPEMGDPAAIAADKKYAQNLINDLYKQVQSGKLTWEQAAEIEKNDPIVGENIYPALSHSGPFDTSQNTEGLFAAAAARKTVSGLKAGQTSKPFVVTVESPGTGKSFESYFLVVRMDSTSGGGSNNAGDFQQYLLQAKKRLGYHVYV